MWVFLSIRRLEVGYTEEVQLTSNEYYTFRMQSTAFEFHSIVAQLS